MFKNSDYVAVRSNVQIAASFFGMSKNSAQAEGRRTLGLRTFLGWFLLLLLFSCSVMSDSLQPQGLRHTRLLCPSLSPGICSNSSIELVIPSNYLIFCRPLPLLSSIFPSNRVCSSESTLHEVAKGLEFQLYHHSFQRNRRVDLFQMDWLELLAIQGTLKSLLQYHSSKVSILWRSAFFTVQLSPPYMTTGKTIALTRQTLVGISASEYAI